jgi:hypothetical protein
VADEEGLAGRVAAREQVLGKCIRGVVFAATHLRREALAPIGVGAEPHQVVGEGHRDELVELRPGRHLHLEDAGAEALHDERAFDDRIFLRELIRRPDHLGAQHLRKRIRQLGHLRQRRRGDHPPRALLLRDGNQGGKEKQP